MHNHLLDRYPDSYHGYLIRTDYRIGVQIQLCLSDPDFSEQDRTITALNLLYGYSWPPDTREAVDGLIWFLNGGQEQEEIRTSDAPGESAAFDFDFDSGRIASGFRRTFGIDITRERMHWFEFLALLGDLRDTAFSDVMQIRQTKVSEVSKDKQAEFARMKSRFAIPTKMSETEKAEQDDFLAKVQEAAEKRDREREQREV